MEYKFNRIIIDGNNLYHKCYSISLKKYVDNKDIIIKETINFFIKILNSYIKRFLGDRGYIYILWDNPISKQKIRVTMDGSLIERKKIDPLYKLNRKKQDGAFYRGIDYLRVYLLNYKNNIYDLQITNFEADDIVKGLIDYFKDKKITDRILIISEDLDWARCFDNNVFWYSKNKVYDKDIFLNEYKYIPNEKNIVMYKTIKGDKSDYIPCGIRNIKESDVLRIIDEFDDIYCFLGNYFKLHYLSDLIKEKIRLDKNRLILNYQLVSFIPVDIQLIEKNLIPCKENETVLSILNKFYGIKTDIKFYNNKKVENESNFFKFNVSR